MKYNITEKQILKYGNKEQTVKGLVVPCGKEFKVNDATYDYDWKTEQSTKKPFTNNKESLETSHCDKCIVCKVVSGISKAIVMPQQEVADLFGLGIDGKKSGTGNFESENGILMHYGTIQAIRLTDGTCINNSECWSRGFASCSHPKNAHMYMSLTSVHIALGWKEHLTHIKIIEHNDMGTLFSYEDRFFLNGNGFVVELFDSCKTVNEAYESMKPSKVVFAESEGIEVKRQGELFFIPIQNTTKFPLENLKLITNIQKKVPIELNVALPRRNDFNHIASQIGTLNGYAVVKGMIRHRNHDHKPIRLGDTWHFVVINRVKNVFNRQGRGVD
jgi:hypothetical protein